VTLETPLSDAEIGELDAFLTSEATSDECMDLVTLDGFLTALVIGPRLVAPSVWLPVVWGGTNAPVFESKDQAERIISLLVRRMNMISSMFGENSSGFEPLLYEREVKGTRFWLADDWCFGFIRAMELGHEAWDQLFDDQTNRVLLVPILTLGTQEGLDQIDAAADPASEYALAPAGIPLRCRHQRTSRTFATEIVVRLPWPMAGCGQSSNAGTDAVSPDSGRARRKDLRRP